MLCLFSETNLPIQNNRLSLFPSLPPRYLEFSPRLKLLLLLLAPGMTNKESYPGESAALDYGSVFHCLPPSLVFRSHDHRPQPRQSSLCASEAAAIADHRSCAQWNAGNSTERGRSLVFPDSPTFRRKVEHGHFWRHSSRPSTSCIDFTEINYDAYSVNSSLLLVRYA